MEYYEQMQVNRAVNLQNAEIPRQMQTIKPYLGRNRKFKQIKK
jgi:hypothetical protein